MYTMYNILSSAAPPSAHFVRNLKNEQQLQKKTSSATTLSTALATNRRVATYKSEVVQNKNRTWFCALLNAWAKIRLKLPVVGSSVPLELLASTACTHVSTKVQTHASALSSHTCIDMAARLPEAIALHFPAAICYCAGRQYTG